MVTKNFYCYLIINNINNKIYIGKTSNPNKRWLTHQEDYTHKKYSHFPLYRAMKKYGKENFTYTIIEEFDSETQSLKAEQEWISYFKYIGAELYNITNGGEGTSGFKHRQETKDNQSRFQKEWQEIHGNQFSGKQHTAETILKQSQIKQPLNTLNEKFCPRCEQIKSRTHFYTLKNGKQYKYCKSCELLRGKERRQAGS